jgi:hypothetical protein
MEVKPSNDYGGWRSNVMHQVHDVVDLRAMSLDEYVQDLASNLGFTGKGFVGLAWELIPFSFVVDWFANVGDYFYSLVPAFGYKQLGSCLVTTRYRTSIFTVLEPVEQPGSEYDIVEAPTGTVAGSIWTKTRQALTLPGLGIKTDFRLNELTRMGDAFSLTAVQLGRMFGHSRGRMR